MTQAADMARPLHRRPEGSSFEATVERRAPRGWRRWLRHWIARPLVAVAGLVLPYAYMLYIRFVWWTSQVVDHTWPMYDGMRRHDRVVALLWHEEVFTVAWAYRRHVPHTLASVGNFGRMITGILELCGFQVFRGGSGKRSRERQILLSMVRHMQATPDCLYGITVDGSTGPAYVLKPGGLLIAKACRAPVYLLRTWASNRIALPTWDRTAIPLPFGRIEIFCVGPYWVPPDTGAEAMPRLQGHLEDELRELAVHAVEQVDQVPYARPLPGFPEGWRRRWVPGRLGLRHGPHDLSPEEPPAWAHRAEDREPGVAAPARIAAWRRGDPAPGEPDPAEPAAGATRA